MNKAHDLTRYIVSLRPMTWKVTCRTANSPQFSHQQSASLTGSGGLTAKPTNETPKKLISAKAKNEQTPTDRLHTTRPQLNPPKIPPQPTPAESESQPNPPKHTYTNQLRTTTTPLSLYSKMTPTGSCRVNMDEANQNSYRLHNFRLRRTLTIFRVTPIMMNI